MIETHWHTTSPEVFAVLWARHGTDLVVYATHTCMEGCVFHEHQHVLTAWGFDGAAAPLMRCIRRKDLPDGEETFEYSIAHAQPEPYNDE